VLALLQSEYPKDVRVVYRHFPLISIHNKAALAAQAAEAAGLQGKFWEMHDLLFERQQDWAPLSVEQFQDWLVAGASGLGLDKDKFSADMLSQPIVDKAQAAWDHGVQIGLPGTPFLLVNGDIWPNNLPLNKGNIEALIKLKLLEPRQFSECPPMTIDASKQYVATLHTQKGDIVIELYPDKTPLAVNNFVFLAHNGWFNGVTFHRVLKDFVAQSGDPSGTGFGTPGYAFVNEISPDLKFDKAGVVAMANAGPDSNGSQFFITMAPAPDLDGSFTIFGRVISGMDVVMNLTLRDPSQRLDLPPGDVIIRVDIEEK